MINTQRIMVVAPHPDDETIGCGGTLLRYAAENKDICWLVVTSRLAQSGYSQEATETMESQIAKAQGLYGFTKTIRLNVPDKQVDLFPTGELVGMISDAMNDFQPDTIFVPFSHDVHTDHQHISKATLSCCKWFRHGFIKNVLFYETLSETDFNLNSAEGAYRPNMYVDISDYFAKKIDAMQIYASEVEPFPFPRSAETLESLARLRGSQCGAKFAEAFMLLRAVS